MGRTQGGTVAQGFLRALGDLLEKTYASVSLPSVSTPRGARQFGRRLTAMVRPRRCELLLASLVRPRRSVPRDESLLPGPRPGVREALRARYRFRP